MEKNDISEIDTPVSSVVFGLKHQSLLPFYLKSFNIFFHNQDRAQYLWPYKRLTISFILTSSSVLLSWYYIISMLCSVVVKSRNK